MNETVAGVVQLYGTFEDEQHVSLVMEHCTAGDLFKTMLVHGGVLDEHWVCIQVWILQMFFEVLQQSHTVRNWLKVGRARPDDGGGLHQTLRR